MSLQSRQRTCSAVPCSTTSQPTVQHRHHTARSRRSLVCAAVLQSQPNIRDISQLQAGVLKDIKADGVEPLTDLQLRDVKVCTLCKGLCWGKYSTSDRCCSRHDSIH